MKSFIVSVTIIFAYLIISINSVTPSFKVDSQPTLTLLNKNSQVYTLSSPGYQDPILIGNFTGSHYEIGYAAGYMLANEAYNNYESILKAILPFWAEREILEMFLDWQWRDFLSKQFTQNYLDEIQGFDDGASDSGFTKLGKSISRAVVLSSFPGDAVQNIEALLKDEVESVEFNKYLEFIGRLDLIELKMKLFNQEYSPKVRGMQCSHYSAWGSRTLNGDMFNGRNLDWFSDTGISKNKMITFYHPTGSYSHASIGFAGLLGAIVGISSQGIFTAESDNDSNLVTFKGLSWSLRLRYIMEHAQNIDEAKQLWESTNNTMGMNHMLSSANEASTNPHPALALETMKGYTAFFTDNDPNELYIYTDPKTKLKTQMGYPLPEAVYRTNHGYDSIIRANQYQLPTPTDDSMIRYMLFPEIFNDYQNAGKLIGELESINITSILGAKSNDENFFDCSQADVGTNVISAAFHFANRVMYVAYEEGTKENRICACCGTFVKVDLSPFFVSNGIN
eukprot:gene4340-5432_t